MRKRLKLMESSSDFSNASVVSSPLQRKLVATGVQHAVAAGAMSAEPPPQKRVKADNEDRKTIRAKPSLKKLKVEELTLQTTALSHRNKPLRSAGVDKPLKPPPLHSDTLTLVPSHSDALKPTPLPSRNYGMPPRAPKHSVQQGHNLFLRELELWSRSPRTIKNIKKDVADLCRLGPEMPRALLARLSRPLVLDLVVIHNADELSSALQTPFMVCWASPAVNFRGDDNFGIKALLRAFQRQEQEMISEISVFDASTAAVNEEFATRLSSVREMIEVFTGVRTLLALINYLGLSNTTSRN